MSTNTTLPATSAPFYYSIDFLQEEVFCLVERGMIDRRQPIGMLRNYFPKHEWNKIVCELERFDYLLRDRISDLIGDPKWKND